MRWAPTASQVRSDRAESRALAAALRIGELEVPGLAKVAPVRSPVVMLRRGMHAGGRRFAWSCRVGLRCRGWTCRGS